MNLIKVLVKPIGEALRVVEIEDNLESVQDLVGGIFQCIPAYVGSDLFMYLNDEGKMIGLEGNFKLTVEGKLVDFVVGNAFFGKHDKKGNLISLADFDIERIKSRFITTNEYNYS